MLFLRERARRRMEANDLGIILFEYAQWLGRLGYSRNTIHQYTQALEHLGFWRAGRHTSSRSPEPSQVEEFLSGHLRADAAFPNLRARR